MANVLQASILDKINQSSNSAATMAAATV